MRYLTLTLVAFLASCSGVQTPPDSAAEVAPPKIDTPRRPVTDVYHGVEVVDDYRWLEDSSDPEVQAWSDQQNALARKELSTLPNLEAIRARVTEITKAQSVAYWSLSPTSDHVFAVVREPAKQHPFLVVMDSLAKPGEARVVVDPGALDPEGLTAMDWYVPSPDGKLVAVSLSRSGTEAGDVSVVDVATGKVVHEVVPRVNGGTAGGDLAWAGDGSGFFYTRYPRGDERKAVDKDFYLQVYFHKLGTPTADDRYEMGKDLPRIAEIDLTTDRATGRLLATVQKGDGGEFELHMRAADGQWRKFSEFGDKVIQAAFAPGGDLYVLSRHDAPRGKILRVSGETLDLSKGEVVVPEGDDTIVDSFWGSPTILPVADRIFVLYQTGGPSEIRVFDRSGKAMVAPDQLPVSSASGLTRFGDEKVLFYNTSYIAPGAWFEYDPAKGTTTKTALASTSPVDFSGIEVRREFATSKDGTKVPLNILLPKGVKLDGSNPCIVNAYGGYGVNITPHFRASKMLYLEQGVIYVVANIRGGGEYGEQWHLQGNLTHKQNVFDDFAASIQYMITKGYTQRDRLGIIGGSNGGLLMGATMVQHPELVRAVVSSVGIYDMLRVELSPNGAFNVTEFGTVKDPEQFKALYAYSPYHNVKDGVKYPAVLFTTGANDPRVDPMQSRKMTARLQAATASDAPVMLRTNNLGHGLATPLDERIAQRTDAVAFLLSRLGVSFRSIL